MAEKYIEINRLLELKDEGMNWVYDLYDLEEFLEGILGENGKDVLNITRCGECMFSSNISRTCLCSKSGKYMRVNDFCSYGTPKERGGEK